MSTPTGEYVRTYYMSRRLDLPPLVAQAAYDAHVAGSSNQGWLLRSATARLCLRGSVRRYSGPGWWPLRSQRGSLTAGWHRWPVELELLPWSSEHTELGLRPGSDWARSSPPASVTHAGHDLLDLLAATMRVWADQPLRDWAASAADLPVHLTDRFAPRRGNPRR